MPPCKRAFFARQKVREFTGKFMGFMGRLANKKTIAVTGGLGFIGSHFVERCLAKGHRIINYDKQSYAANADLLFEGDYHYHKVDINEIQVLPDCDVLVNFASETHVDRSIGDCSDFIKSNLVGVFHLLELLRNKAENPSGTIPLFVQISTDEVFGDQYSDACKEDFRHKPSNPYAATKSGAEQLLYAWGRTYGLPYIITRSTNTYGLRQHSEKLIPHAIHCISNGKKVPIHGGGRYVRNWIHVLDSINALLTIVDKGEIGKVYHLASDEDFSVNEIVQKVCDLMEVRFEDVTDFSSDRPGADVYYALDYSGLCELGWRQERTMELSLPELVEKYRRPLKDGETYAMHYSRLGPQEFSFGTDG